MKDAVARHWETVYQTKAPDAVSWYAPHLSLSLGLIRRAALSTDTSIIDVGGGESTLVDDLLDLGYSDLHVAEISSTAIDVTKARLSTKADRVRWWIGDITRLALPERRFDIWHDRAVFHFLTDENARSAYVASVCRSVKTGGHVIVATFGPEGPTQCSGLDVMRYDADGLHRQFGARFRLVESSKEMHHTPWGKEQQFLYCYCILEDGISRTAGGQDTRPGGA